MVGYSIDSRMKSRLAFAALDHAVARRGDVAGCVLHTDRGSQFRSREFVHAINRHSMVGSMDRVGAAGDGGEIPRDLERTASWIGTSPARPTAQPGFSSGVAPGSVELNRCSGQTQVVGPVRLRPLLRGDRVRTFGPFPQQATYSWKDSSAAVKTPPLSWLVLTSRVLPPQAPTA